MNPSYRLLRHETGPEGEAYYELQEIETGFLLGIMSNNDPAFNAFMRLIARAELAATAEQRLLSNASNN